MVGHGRAPGVEHGGEADAGTEMLRVGGDPRQGRARGPEQQIVDGGLVLEGDGGDLGGQGEDDVEVADREEVGLAGGEPVPRRRTLAAWAVPVTAGIVGDAQVAARVAALDMPAEAGRAALLDRRHHLERRQVQVPGPIGAIGGTGGAEDVGQLDRGGHRLSPVRVPPHGTGRACRGGSSRPAPSGWRPWRRVPSCRGGRVRAAPG